MPSRTRSLITDAIKIGAISLALLFLAEAVLRSVYPEEVLDTAEEHQRISQLAFRFHPDYGIELVPDVSKSFERSESNGGALVPWHTNSFGFRGHELRANPDVRIIVLGDSNILARFSPLEETFSYQLERRLTALTGRDIEVVNGGVVGSGPDQSLIRLSTEIEQHDPDVIVFHVFADNDFGDLVRNRLFELDGAGALVRSGQPVTIDQELQSREPRLLLVWAMGKAMGLIGSRLERWGLVGPMTAESQIQMLLDRAAIEFSNYETKGPRVHSHFADHYDMDVAVNPDSPAVREKVALMERILVEAKALAVAQGASFLVLIQPSTRDLTQSWDLNYTQFGRDPDYRRDGLSSIVDRICSKNGIDRVNLFPLFSRSEPRHLYFPHRDDHWNDAGQALAAREVADDVYRQFLQ